MQPGSSNEQSIQACLSKDPPLCGWESEACTCAKGDTIVAISHQRLWGLGIGKGKNNSVGSCVIPMAGVGDGIREALKQWGTNNLGDAHAAGPQFSLELQDFHEGSLCDRVSTDLSLYALCGWHQIHPSSQLLGLKTVRAPAQVSHSLLWGRHLKLQAKFNPVSDCWDPPPRGGCF